MKIHLQDFVALLAIANPVGAAGIVLGIGATPLNRPSAHRRMDQPTQSGDHTHTDFRAFNTKSMQAVSQSH